MSSAALAVGGLAGARIVNPWGQWRSSHTLSPDAPFELSSGTSWSTLPCDGSDITDVSELGENPPAYYDPSTNKIVAVDGTAFHVVFEMNAQTATQAGTYLELGIDIGGSVGVIDDSVIGTFLKGTDPVGVLRSVQCFAKDTWAANGGTPVVRANQAIDIEAIEIRVFPPPILVPSTL